jgi:hypothetical protein
MAGSMYVTKFGPKGELRAQKFSFTESGPHGDRRCVNVGVVESVGVKIPASEYPAEPPDISAPNWKTSPWVIPTSFKLRLFAKIFCSLTVIPVVAQAKAIVAMLTAASAAAAQNML